MFMGYLLAGYWHHNFDPFIIRFPEGFFLPGIRWYGMAYLAGFFIGWLLLRVLAARNRLGGVRVSEVSDVVFWCAVGAVLGGRIGYALFYNFSMTVREPWTLLQVWQGGMASHGGILGVTIALVAWWGHRLRRPPPPSPEAEFTETPDDEGGAQREGTWDAGDREANEKGKATTTRAATPRARKRRHVRAPHTGRSGYRTAESSSPEAISTDAPLLKRWAMALRSTGFWRLGDGIVAVAPVGLFFGRMANFINGELWGRQTEVPWAVVFPESPPPLVPRHPSALYEAFLEGIVLFCWLFPGVLRGRWRAGGAGVRFVLGYAAVRFIVEFFREPDEGIGFQLLHLTRGQWLSIVMAGVGVALFKWVTSLHGGGDSTSGDTR